MARARNIKPGFFKNEILGTADPLAVLLFAGLWCLADRAGRLEDRPIRIKAEIFPYREKLDINRYLTDLERMGFVKRYVVDNLALIQIVNFHKHQHPHHTEKDSELPECKEGSSLTVKAPENHGSTPSDSLNTDSLIPDSLEYVRQAPDASSQCKELLQFLNDKAGRAYKPVPANLDLLKARLREGYTPTEIRQVIVKKCREWAADEKMAEYLRPATLFSRRNLAQYTGELVVPKEAHA